MKYLRPQQFERIKSWKSGGETIVFTNGCFDLLHPGHLDCLLKCRTLGDRLIVGVNSDASVKRLKGTSRPVMGQSDRKRTLEALKVVDLVVIFDDDTPEALIREILPDILAKGSDYKKSNISGADIVIQNGGKVLLIDLLPGYSTSDLINKIQQLKR